MGEVVEPEIHLYNTLGKLSLFNLTQRWSRDCPVTGYKHFKGNKLLRSEMRSKGRSLLCKFVLETKVLKEMVN